MSIIELTSEQARRRCDPQQFSFETTAELPFEDNILGQPRALRALDFGLNIDAPGYNVFVVGANGTGRLTAIRQVVENAAKELPAPSDWVYVHNFNNPRAPIALKMKAGAATKMRDAMERNIAQAQINLPSAFETDEYDAARDEILSALRDAQDTRLSEVNDKAMKRGFVLTRTASGLAIAPQEGSPPPNEPNALRELNDALDDAMRAIRETEKTARGELEKLDAIVASAIIAPMMDEIADVADELVESEDRPALEAHLLNTRNDLIKNVAIFKLSDEPQDPMQLALFLNRYRVNVFVDNCETCGAPVVFEDTPTYFNLLGRVDRTLTISNNPIMAAQSVDHMMLRPGAMHRANGGFLVLAARELLDYDSAYGGLKRSLQMRSIKIQDPDGQQVLSAPTLEPQPIPLQVKVVLFGDALAYWRTLTRDEEMAWLFKVKAEFVTEMERSRSNESSYATFIRQLGEEEKLAPFDRSGVAAMVEFGSRYEDDQDKLSTKFGEVADLAREASFYAKRAKRNVATAEDVRTALSERRMRLDWVEKWWHEHITSGSYTIQLSGDVVGQVNGISVHSTEQEFATPTRISARSYVMRGGITDIDRGVGYTDNSHNKGIALIDSYLSALYSTESVLSVSANVTFEESHGSHSGDSASCAILIAMLSAVTNEPAPQSVGITGTLDQFGNVRLIGGTNTKVEGFFEVCKLNGLNGLQGVILPKANMRDLMLREDIVDAVREGTFHIVAVEHVDDLIELMFGMSAGKRGEDGKFPAGTFHALVEAALKEINDKLDGKRKGDKEEKRDEEKKPEPEKPPEPEPEPPKPDPEPPPAPPSPEPDPPDPQIDPTSD
jgi:predicted ATP-dependent protease